MQIPPTATATATCPFFPFDARWHIPPRPPFWRGRWASPLSEKCWICPQIQWWIIILPWYWCLFSGVYPIFKHYHVGQSKYNQRRDLINEKMIWKGDWDPKIWQLLRWKPQIVWEYCTLVPNTKRGLFHRNVDGKGGQQKGPLGVYNGPKQNLNVCSLA